MWYESDLEATFSDSKIYSCELALWGSPFRLSNLKCFEGIFVGGVRIILFVMKKGFQLNAAKHFRFESLNGLSQRASFLSKNVATISTNLNSIVTPNFPILVTEVTQAADKGGVAVVWRADLCQKESIKITDHFSSTSANVIYCITCTYCNKLYIGETRRRLGGRFREHLRDVEGNYKDASKTVARHFYLPNHSKQHMAICGLSLHLGSSNHSRASCFIRSRMISRPHRLKKTSSMQ